MTATLLTPILIILILLFVLIGALRGYKKGAVRSAVNLAVLVAAAFLGAGLAVLISALLYNPAYLMLYSFGAITALESLLGSFYVIVLIVIGMLATLLCFLPCFFIMYFLLSLLMRIILAARAGKAMSEGDGFFSEEDDILLKREKRIGAMIGAASALLVSVVVLSPVTGALKATASTVDLVSEFSGMKVEDMAPIVVELVDYSKDGAVTVIDACGGRMWFNMATTTRCYGSFTNINKEIKILNEIGTEELADILKDIGTLGDESLAKFESLIDRIGRSPIMKLLLSVAVNDMSTAWLSGGEYKGAARPDMGNEIISDFVDEVLRILRTTEVETVEADVTTMLKLVSIIREYEDVLNTGSYADMADLLSEGQLADRLKNEIRKNKRMLSLEQSIDDILMRSFAEEISDFSQFTPEQREELYGKLADILTSSIGLDGKNRVNMVAGDITDALDSYGVYAPDGMATEIAEVLISELSSDGSMVSIEDVSSYFEAYLSSGAALPY